jgi:hypothetical protein
VNKKSNLQNSSLGRQLVLLKLIQEKLKVEKNDYVMLSVAELKKHELLNDFNNVKIVLERISKDPEDLFSYEIITKGVITSVLDDDMKNLPKEPYKIKIIIEDKKKFANQIVELEKKIKKEENNYNFILNEDRELFIEGNKAGPYQIEKDSLRHKLIYFLATKKRFISAQELAVELRNEPDRIRKTVGQIRTMIKKVFKISGHSLIQTDESTGGYCINNVTLKVPKGYTPL